MCLTIFVNAFSVSPGQFYRRITTKFRLYRQLKNIDLIMINNFFLNRFMADPLVNVMSFNTSVINC